MSETTENVESNELTDKWNEIRVLVESMDIDIKKNATKSNQSAGLRSRRALRLLKKLTHELLMSSVAYDKQIATAKKEQ